MQNPNQATMLNLLNGFRTKAADSYYSLSYSPEDFEHSESEEFITVHRRTDDCKSQDGNILNFWLHSLFGYLEDSRTDFYFEEAVRESLCRAVSEDELQSRVSPLMEGLKSKAVFEYSGQFLGAFQMYDDWNFVAIVGESSAEYFSFYWETTA